MTSDCLHEQVKILGLIVASGELLLACEACLLEVKVQVHTLPSFHYRGKDYRKIIEGEAKAAALLALRDHRSIRRN